MDAAERVRLSSLWYAIQNPCHSTVNALGRAPGIPAYSNSCPTEVRKASGEQAANSYFWWNFGAFSAARCVTDRLLGARPNTSA